MKCPACAADAYVGFSSVECSNPVCAHYVAPLITIGPNGVMIQVADKKYLAKVDIKAAADKDSGFMDKFIARIKAIPCLDGRKYAEEVCKAYRQEQAPEISYS